MAGRSDLDMLLGYPDSLYPPSDVQEVRLRDDLLDRGYLAFWDARTRQVYVYDADGCEYRPVFGEFQDRHHAEARMAAMDEDWWS